MVLYFLFRGKITFYRYCQNGGKKMFQDGDRVLLLMKDASLRIRTAEYLQYRYNLEVTMAEDLLEVLALMCSGEDVFEALILDEDVAGLAATSHAIRKIRCQRVRAASLYLSDLPEIVHPQWGGRFRQIDALKASYVREELILKRVNKMAQVSSALMSAYSVTDICGAFCSAMKETLEVDNVVCILLKMDTNTATYGLAMEDLNQDSNYLVSVDNSPTLRHLVKYCKPVHCPELGVDPALKEEILRKFGMKCRSALLAPIPVMDACIGFIGLFNTRRRRMFTLPDLEHVIRGADLAGGAIIFAMARENGLLGGLQKKGEDAPSIFSSC